jgi:hypothetical protein
MTSNDQAEINTGKPQIHAQNYANRSGYKLSWHEAWKFTFLPL